MKTRILTLLLVALLTPTLLLAHTPLWQGKGRIAISSDGNKHDTDDWSATAMTLALLASQKLQDKLVLYTYSDHVWGSSTWKPHGVSAYDQMKESALGGQRRFGFTNSKFICAVDDPEIAYNAMAEEINKSTAENPLIVLAGGPMQVIGEALNRADKSKRQYVTVVSHSYWNNEHSDWWSDDIDRPFPSMKELEGDKHSGWTFAEMRESFENKRGGGAKFIEILDQNGGKDYEGLSAPINRFEWLVASDFLRSKQATQKLRENWVWLYTRLLMHMHIKNGKFDVSDSGLALYMLTGIEKTDMDLLRKYMER